MIKITFIVPYPELMGRVHRVLHRYQNSSKQKMEVFLTEISWMCPELIGLLDASDVLIARGYAAKLMLTQNEVKIPVVEMTMSAYDIIRAVMGCEQRFGAKAVGLVGPFVSKAEAQTLDTLFSCSFRAYFAPAQSDIPGKVQEALDDGCDAIIGGNHARMRAQELHCPALTIQTGENAIWQALDEAVRTVEFTRRERERTQMFTTITNTAKDGILYVSCGGVIQVANPAAGEMLAHGGEPLLGRDIQTLSEPLAQTAAEVCRTGQEVSNQLCPHNKNTLSVEYSPIRIDHNVTGVVVTFQDITRIQQTEAQIRQKLSEKGLAARYRFEDIIHRSPLIDQLIQRARHYAAVDSNVLIEGETGTGKELLAQSIHNASPRHRGPFVAVNCAAIPENLLESEMFGYEEGAFTGSIKGGKAGLFELAHTGTLFLDEVSELPLSFQGKILRVLQEREVRRVGGGRVKAVDVRIITASNCNLLHKVKNGTFRQDLFYRLDVLKLYIPPLRRRREDIQLLFLHFLRIFAQKYGISEYSVDPGALDVLQEYDYTGNVREMRNIAERACILCIDSGRVGREDLCTALYDEGEADFSGGESTHVSPIKKLSEESQRSCILSALERCGYNQTKAAQELGIDRTTLWRKMQKFGIARRS